MKNNFKTNKWLLTIIPLLFFQQFSFGQDNREYKEWITIGFGYNYPPSRWGNGIALEGQYNFGKKNYYQVNLRHTRKDVMGGRYQLQTLGFQKGLRIFRKWYLGAIFTGPAIIWGKIKNENSNSEQEYFFGWEGNIQYFLRAPVFPELGIGIMGYLSLNKVENHYGIQLSILMGNAK